MTDKPSAEGASFLDKPVFGNLKITWWWVIWVALILFVVGTRFWALGDRGYEHDESIHAWESWKLATGQGYAHDPVYHGPFLYHLTALIFLLFGDNNTTARLGTALGGVIITIMPYFLRDWLGKKGALVATLLLAVSPVMMTRSRYIWHDQWSIVFNLMFLIGILRYIRKSQVRDLYLIVVALVLGYTTKSTTFITYAIFGTFLLGVYGWQLLRAGLRSWSESPLFDILLVIGTLSLPLATPLPVMVLGGNPVDYSPAGIARSGTVFAVLLLIGAGIGLWWNWRRWLVCVGIFYGVFIPLFTTMFTNGNGLATGLVGMLGYWLTQQQVRRGGQPAHYYIVLMSLYEFLPLLVGIGATVYYALRGDPHRAAHPAPTEAEGPAKLTEAPARQPVTIPFVLLLIYWAWLAFLIYSWAGEKMPWLSMHLVVPLDLLAAWAIVRLLTADWQAIRSRGGLWMLLAVPLAVYTVAKLLGAGLSTATTTQSLSESMSWLVELVVAAILAVFIWNLVRKLGTKSSLRMAALGGLVVLLALTLRFAWMASFINAGLASEFIVYAQGTPDDALVAHELEDMSRRLAGDLSMKVAYDDDSSWPFVWYLRNFTNAQFYGKQPGAPFDAEVVIVGPANEAAVKPFLGSKYYRRQYRLIWWPDQDWYMNMTPRSLWNSLTNPVERRKFLDVVWKRKYEKPLTAWPLVHNFALYVRRDVASQLWDYGPETVGAAGAVAGDDYVEKWKVVSALSAWGSVGNQAGQFMAPKGLAFDPQGNIYVADSRNHRIQVLDSGGRPLRQWGSEGAQQGQFKEPWGVAVAPNGDVYVADTWNHRVQVFDRDGNFMRMWGVFGESGGPNGPGDVYYGPRDLAFDSQGFLYVADTGNKRVVKYDADGNMVGAVGGLGAEDGQMQEPVGIAIDKNDMLYVADTWNQRVQVFDSKLNLVRKWSVLAWDGNSVVNKPYLAVDAAGNVFVTDPGTFRVLKFDPQGKLLLAWGQSGSDLSSMNLPTGIKIDKAGRVVVTDSENGRILVFAGN